MLKSLSKSTKLMFLYDFLTLSLITALNIYYFRILDSNLIIELLIIGIVVIAGLFSLFLKGQYKIREHNITGWNFYRLLEGVIFAHIPAGILLLFWVDKIMTLKFIGINAILVFTSLCLYRLIFHYYLFNLKTIKKVLIVGINQRAKDIAEEIINKQALKMEVAGLVKTDEFDKKFSEVTQKIFKIRPSEVNQENEEIILDNKYKVYELDKDFSQIVNESEADIVVFTKPSWLMSCVPYGVKEYLMPEFYEMITGKFYVDLENAMEFRCELSRRNNIKTKLFYDIPKRIFDIISALIILTVTLPITGYIAIRVKLTDGGSPFFSQTRVGRDGKTFECYKLRTMYLNDFVPKNAQQLTDNSDRVMPFCKLVRKAKLDEIPQMVNILKGEMSIVGPRAEWENFKNVFEGDVPFYRFRNLVRAGWTGWAHINMQAAYSVDEEKERLAYDLYYIKHRNVFWEIAILVKAVFLAVGGRHK